MYSYYVCGILCVLATKAEDIGWRWIETLSYEKKKGRERFVSFF